MTLTVARKILDLLVGFAFVTAAIVTNPVVENVVVNTLGTIGINATTHCGMFDCDARLDTSTIDDLR
jgi:hypothetical protein